MKMGGKRRDILDFEDGSNRSVPASVLHIGVAVKLRIVIIIAVARERVFQVGVIPTGELTAVAV